MSVLTSIQLFTVKSDLEENLEETLDTLVSRGFTTVEPYDFVRRADALAAALSARGLAAPTGHAFVASASFVNPDGTPTDNDVPTLDATFTAAEKLGMGVIIEPYTDPARWTSIEQIQEIAELLNRAAEAAAERGIRIGYHNHAHELEARFGDLTGLEVLANHLDPRVVLEVDLYWAARAGVDVLALLRTLGERVIALHVKDGTLDPEKVNAYPPADQVAAGEGTVPLADALATATALEVAVVEFDHFEGDLYAAVESSRAFIDEALATDSGTR
ncbi:xylose isomerase [Microbacterium sp. CH12i]|uniref:sugar phosphate isomerase/epimerase family protein n=1 Tax=Microbacterium sp. CH12i TaxID=1479651 RepID=UPI000461AD96|nr:sugar phosphate isomerase/epimerase [Microbacterium sp. CH12i]KDA06878.1 xylose isomerase [Microbacterium sp. CH12i]